MHKHSGGGLAWRTITTSILLLFRGSRPPWPRVGGCRPPCRGLRHLVDLDVVGVPDGGQVA
eukprot:972954-Alexandrium_andersonii.AAC.1